MTPAPAPNVAAGTYTTRILPADEWFKVAGLEPFTSRGLPEADSNWMILVVEHEGQIVGTCSLFMAMHWDCWQMAPNLPGAVRSVVLRQLLAVALEILGSLGVEQVYTGVEPSSSSNAAQLLKRFGFKPAAGQLFILDLAEVSQAFRPQES